MPTAHAASPLNSLIVGDEPLPPVWPDPHGNLNGVTVSPLYKSVPYAARRDEKLYQLLAAVDGLRIGRVRERAVATSFLQSRVAPDEAVA